MQDDLHTRPCRPPPGTGSNCAREHSDVLLVCIYRWMESRETDRQTERRTETERQRATEKQTEKQRQRENMEVKTSMMNTAHIAICGVSR